MSNLYPSLNYDLSKFTCVFDQQKAYATATKYYTKIGDCILKFLSADKPLLSAKLLEPN